MNRGDAQLLRNYFQSYLPGLRTDAQSIRNVVLRARAIGVS